MPLKKLLLLWNISLSKETQSTSLPAKRAPTPTHSPPKINKNCKKRCQIIRPKKRPPFWAQSAQKATFIECLTIIFNKNFKTKISSIVNKWAFQCHCRQCQLWESMMNLRRKKKRLWLKPRKTQMQPVKVPAESLRKGSIWPLTRLSNLLWKNVQIEAICFYRHRTLLNRDHLLKFSLELCHLRKKVSIIKCNLSWESQEWDRKNTK